MGNFYKYMIIGGSVGYFHISEVLIKIKKMLTII